MKGHNFRNIILIAFITIFVIVSLMTPVYGKKGTCRACKNLANGFIKGLEKTRKGNFGGGNTRWEEKTLGKYPRSETRFVEIWDDYLCQEGAKQQCQMLLEENEHHLNELFFVVLNETAEEDVDVMDWLCFNKIEACCPNNTFGPTCEDCPGGRERPCMGHGTCEGSGFRVGAGECRCSDGYEGKICDKCNEKYFEEFRNETDVICSLCHMSCTLTCTADGPKGCDECYKGWTKTEEDGCVDNDECQDTPCEENQYCSNTPGSYNCFTCHRACQGCSEYGADKCEACGEGYVQQEEMCVDVDECTADSSLCSGDKQSCENKDGSYECKCEDGYIYEEEEQICIPKPIEEDDKGLVEAEEGNAVETDDQIKDEL